MILRGAVDFKPQQVGILALLELGYIHVYLELHLQVDVNHIHGQILHYGFVRK